MRIAWCRPLFTVVVFGLLVPVAACTGSTAEEDGFEAVESEARAASSASARQQAFAEAAQEFGVPESLLLAVSYLESRWDSHDGQPSRAAGYGPMHLTDAASVIRWPHHSAGEDPRGDDARPEKRPGQVEVAPGDIPLALQTIDLAAELTGTSTERLRADPAENIRGGAALLAHHQKQLGHVSSRDPADWYGAVARYSGATDTIAARQFADEVYAVLAEGTARTTDDGQRIGLAAQPDVEPEVAQLAELGLREVSRGRVECPDEISCEWIPAPYEDLGGGDYGNHDLADRPDSQRVRYIIIHDTEVDYETTLRLVQDPAYVSWHYTLRSHDGHIAQHVETKDVAWHAGNWYVNAKSIGLEHEGFAAQGTWYTEAMYRTSAKLVRYLARRHRIPLDRAHILGHDNVPGSLPATVRRMHWDPGPYWDWSHYFDLLRAPFWSMGGPGAGMVTIKPDYATNRPAFIACDPSQPAAPCPARGSSSVILRTEPRADAPLLKDIGLRPDGSDSTMQVSDIGSRVDAGQQYAVAGRTEDWTAIWYLGQKGWFYNPASAPNALWAIGWVATPRPGKPSIPVYGRAYPEADAYPADVSPQEIVPLQYTLSAGQRYAVGLIPETEYYRAVTFDPQNHIVVSGDLRYYQIQFGHRVAYVMADDVWLAPSPLPAAAIEPFRAGRDQEGATAIEGDR